MRVRYSTHVPMLSPSSSSERSSMCDEKSGAPATVPAMQAASPSLAAVLPATNWPPPRENWMIIGPLYMAAASRHALTEHDETTLTAGIAYLFSLAWFSRSHSASPVTTPGLTEEGSGVVVAVCMRTAERGAAAAGEP